MAADKERKKTKKHEQQPLDPTTSTSRSAEALFKPSSTVKGIRFGGQFVVRSFTVRRAAPLELFRLLNIPLPTCRELSTSSSDPATTGIHYFSSTAAYIPTSFTILAHQAWRTLTLGLGSNKSKIIIFVFDSDAACSATADRLWPATIPLGDVNRRLIRWMAGCEMARFKFRKGALTFYIYAVRPVGVTGFARTDDLRALLKSVDALCDFVDHTAMLAMPTRRSITFSPSSPAGISR